MLVKISAAAELLLSGYLGQAVLHQQMEVMHQV